MLCMLCMLCMLRAHTAGGTIVNGAPGMFKGSMFIRISIYIYIYIYHCAIRRTQGLELPQELRGPVYLALEFK